MLTQDGREVLPALAGADRHHDPANSVSALFLLRGYFKGFRKNMILTMDKEKILSKAFGVDKLPEGFIFDGEGKLKKKIIGIQDWATPNAIQFFKSL